jgi:2-dehydro-3-deoxyphosphogluconate aldolase / (4S)-4-hydroxy-2-oxoglutarate aldolase
MQPTTASSSTMKQTERILAHKVVAIVRGLPANQIIRTVEALHEGGIRIVEVTLNSPSALEQIQLLKRHFGTSMMVGAGTVLDVPGAAGAISAGAAFLVSPGYDVEVIRYANDHHVVSVPGGYTATEILNAFRAGGDIIKVFPVSGAEYLKNLIAPLDHIPMMPTGGINAGNIRSFAEAGAVAFGIGSALVHKTDTYDDHYFQSIREKASNLLDALEKTL